MTLRDDIVTVLEADGTLTALLTGGIHTGTEISRTGTPGAFDANLEILPCALVKMESDVQSGPFTYGYRTVVVIYLYQRSGYDTIDAALDRILALLHDKQLWSGTWLTEHAGDVPGLEDQALQCSLAISRYAVTRNRE